MQTPIVLVTGVHPDAMAVLTVGLQWDLPCAVAVRHRIDVERQVLERVVSDPTGVLERTEIDLEHACVSCALREDVIPTLQRLANDGRWSSVIAHLPVGARAEQVCAVVAGEARVARDLRITAVMAAVAGSSVEADLLGDDLLAERGLHTSHDDRRGVGEVLAGMIEYADVVVLTEEAEPSGHGLVRALARPDAAVLADTSEVDSSSLVSGRLHRHEITAAWVAADRRAPLPDVAGDDVWRVDLRSDRPFHPERLLEDIGRLGSGRHRSRGCFWLPTRPGRVCAWDGAGGQLSIGSSHTWRPGPPHTRIVLIGVGWRPAGLERAFDSLLVTPGEIRRRGRFWEVGEDGLEPWLGPVRRAA